MSEMFSQEEINELLNSNSSESAGNNLAEMEIGIISEVVNICMGSAAAVLSDQLGKTVTIDTPVVRLTDYQTIKDSYKSSYVVVDVPYIEGLVGNKVMLVESQSIKSAIKLLENADGEAAEGETDEIELGKVSEIINQLAAASVSSVSQLANKTINISNPSVEIIDLTDDAAEIKVLNKDGEIVSIQFDMQIEEVSETNLTVFLDYSFAKSIIDDVVSAQQKATAEEAAENTEEDIMDVQDEEVPEEDFKDIQQGPAQNFYQPASSSVDVRTVQFEDFSAETPVNTSENLGLLMDVPLQVTVELGRTKKTLQEIFELSTGSIVTLDKLSGELVDVVVNGKRLAKGEVVVADDNFAVRITEIIKNKKI